MDVGEMSPGVQAARGRPRFLERAPRPRRPHSSSSPLARRAVDVAERVRRRVHVAWVSRVRGHERPPFDRGRPSRDEQDRRQANERGRRLSDRLGSSAAKSSHRVRHARAPNLVLGAAGDRGRGRNAGALPRHRSIACHRVRGCHSNTWHLVSVGHRTSRRRRAHRRRRHRGRARGWQAVARPPRLRDLLRPPPKHHRLLEPAHPDRPALHVRGERRPQRHAATAWLVGAHSAGVRADGHDRHVRGQATRARHAPIHVVEPTRQAANRVPLSRTPRGLEAGCRRAPSRSKTGAVGCDARARRSHSGRGARCSIRDRGSNASSGACAARGTIRVAPCPWAARTTRARRPISMVASEGSRGSSSPMPA